ncbi:MAG: MFS transporter [Pseudomonadota bacterium]|nr:MFS transporter [Pseudomonadota bacterium]
MEHPYRWMIVVAGGLMGCIAIGTMFSLAVFLEPMATQTGWSRTGISAAMTVNFLVMAIGNLGWGVISDRHGARLVVTCGSGLLGLALVLASRAESLSAFQWTYGVLVGLSASAFFAPMMALTTAWFERQRALAVSLVSVGMGMAPLTVSPFARWLLTTTDWRTAMLTIGLLAWVLLLPATRLVRQPPAAAHTAARPPGAGAQPSAWQVLGTPQFVVLALTFFMCCAAHAGPIFHMVSYAIACGIGPMAAVSIYSVEGLAGLGGRVLFGLLADRLGVKRVLVSGLLVQALAIAAYLAVSRLGEFYALALIFGAAYGGVMPLYSVLAREYFGQAVLGTVLGAAMMLSSLGMALGPLAGGWVFDRFASYAWLFIGSAGVGLAAVAVALAFPPLPPRRNALA